MLGIVQSDLVNFHFLAKCSCHHNFIEKETAARGGTWFIPGYMREVAELSPRLSRTSESAGFATLLCPFTDGGSLWTRARRLGDPTVQGSQAHSPEQNICGRRGRQKQTHEWGLHSHIPSFITLHSNLVHLNFQESIQESIHAGKNDYCGDPVFTESVFVE